MKPLIAIFTHREATSAKTDASCLNRAYSDAVLKNGAVPVLIPYTDDLSLVRRYLDMCIGIILPGGADVTPSLYGEAPHEKLGGTDITLDDSELFALDYCAEKQLPVFGICRGLQLMNVHASGSLFQDIPSQCSEVLSHRQDAPYSTPTHSVKLASDSLLHKISGDTLQVNSLHHQSVKKLGKGYRISAVAEDGIIEGIEHDNGIWFAVQWHPEELAASMPEMNELFRYFISICWERNST